MINTAGTRFLRRVFAESVEDIANITVAEAEEDTEIIIEYLKAVIDFINIEIKDLTNNESN